MQNRLMLFPILCLLTFASCKKQEGPAGAAGDPGVSGPAGDAGEPGHNINVSTSGNLVILGSQWTTPDSVEWRTTISTNVITKAVVDSGYVQTFLQRDAHWYNLPYFEGIYFTSYAYETGKVILIQGSTHGNLPPQPETATYKISAFRN